MDQPRPIVVLAHGFMRRLANIRGWAEHFVSHGVTTVVVSFCNSSWLSGNHDRNGEDLIAVVDAVLEGGPNRSVVYGGFSSGGLAALLAAQADERTIAYLGLDAVDSAGLAASALGIEVPLLFLFGEPSACNADGNMVAARPGGPAEIALRIPFATHCDFENPYDAGCESLCGANLPREAAEEIRTNIKALATAWIVTHARDGADRPLGQEVIRDLLDRRIVLELTAHNAP